MMERETFFPGIVTLIDLINTIKDKEGIIDLDVLDNIKQGALKTIKEEVGEEKYKDFMESYLVVMAEVWEDLNNE